jgi:hypothetical protein
MLVKLIKIINTRDKELITILIIKDIIKVNLIKVNSKEKENLY